MPKFDPSPLSPASPPYSLIPRPSASFLLYRSIPALFILVALLGVLSFTEVKFEATVNWTAQTELFLLLNSWLNQAPAYFWANMTHLGDGLVLIPILALLFLREPSVWRPILYAAPLAGAVCHLLKWLIAAPRPGALLGAGEFIQIGEFLGGHNSFPSGHTVTICTAVSATVCWLLPNLRGFDRRAFLFAGTFMATLVAISRVAVGAHWPLDTLLGAGIGAGAGLIGVHLGHKYQVSFTGQSARAWLSSMPMIMSFALLHRTMDQEFTDDVIYVAIISGFVASALALFELARESLSRKKTTGYNSPSLSIHS